MFTITVSDDAFEDLQYFRKHDQQIILNSIEEQTLHAPSTPTRNRKPLRPNNFSQWELRVRSFRVFYDVDEKEQVVTVKAVGRKRGNVLFIRGQEYRL